jgi:glycosyltransferase involved in cell wall biosynthesis
MRIGIDARLVYYSQAGIGQYVLNLAQWLAQIDGANEYVLLQSRKDNSTIIERANFRRVSLWTPSHHRFEQQALPAEIARLGLDLLHSPDFIPPFRANCRTVITVHDLAFLLYPQFLTRESARYYGQIDQAVRRADHIIADSESTRRDVLRLLGARPEKVSVVYLAANPLYRPVSLAQARAWVQGRFGLTGEFILSVGTIEPRKNLPTLLRAYRQLLDAYKLDVTLAVAGQEGWLYAEIPRLVDELRLRDRVRFLGRVSDEDLLHLYNAAGVLAHPALYEGFGLPPLEAMSCGAPVVVSNTSSLPEVVGDAGLLVEPEDVDAWAVALWRVCTDDDLRDELSQKALARSRRFSWERTARHTLRIYERVVHDG